MANGYKAREYALYTLQLVKNLVIVDKKECDELCDIIGDILAYVVCVPINI
jgi:hypothetical protein